MILLAWALSALTGFLLARAATGGMRWCRHDVFRLALGAGLGTGLTSCGYFAALAAGINCAFADALLLIAAALCFLSTRRSFCVFCKAGHRPAGNPLLPWALAVLCIGATFLFVTLSRHSPHGGWDAWSIYNLRARFLYRAGPAWRATFTPDLAWSHPDYPLLPAASIARLWTYSRAESTFAQSLFAFTFAAAIPAVLIGALRDRTQACVAGILVLSAPYFTVLAAQQYVDVPVAFFLLGALALTCLEEAFPGRAHWLAALAGLSAGLAAWTKNEGLMLLGIFLVLRMIQNKLARLPALLAGAALPLACVLYFKLTLAPPNDLVAGQSIAHAADAARYGKVAWAFLLHTFTFAGLAVSPVIVAAVYLFCFRIQRPVRLVGFALAAAIAGYSITYILSPGDLDWRINGSIDRILIQLWPSAMLWVGLASARTEL